MMPSLLESKVTSSFCFPFKIPDDPTATNMYYHVSWNWISCFRRSVTSARNVNTFLRNILLYHTTSFWNIINQWISRDNLTENLVSLVSSVKLVKWQECKTALCDLTEKLLASNFIGLPNLQIILKSKSMDESSWKFHTITNQEDSSMDLAPESFEDLVVQWS